MELSYNFQKFGLEKNDWYFFRLDGSSGPIRKATHWSIGSMDFDNPKSYRIHRKFAPFLAQIFAKIFVKCKNLHKKLRKHLQHDYFLAFICANICTNFWVSKIFAQISAQLLAQIFRLKNIRANFCAIICSNLWVKTNFPQILFANICVKFLATY